MKIQELYFGDRFRLEDGSLWTYMSISDRFPEDAIVRKHENKQPGYIGSAVCSLPLIHEVEFVPPEVNATPAS